MDECNLAWKALFFFTLSIGHYCLYPNIYKKFDLKFRVLMAKYSHFELKADTKPQDVK